MVLGTIDLGETRRGGCRGGIVWWVGMGRMSVPAVVMGCGGEDVGCPFLGVELKRLRFSALEIRQRVFVPRSLRVWRV
jgi:hypothetical protein